MKLGRLPKKEHSRTLSLSKYVKLAAPPSAFAYEYNVKSYDAKVSHIKGAKVHIPWVRVAGFVPVWP